MRKAPFCRPEEDGRLRTRIFADPARNRGKVQASVARCLRTPPDAAKRLGFRFRFGYRLRGNGHRSMIVVGNYAFRTDNGGTSPSES